MNNNTRRLFLFLSLGSSSFVYSQNAGSGVITDFIQSIRTEATQEAEKMSRNIVETLSLHHIVPSEQNAQKLDSLIKQLTFIPYQASVGPNGFMIAGIRILAATQAQLHGTIFKSVDNLKDALHKLAASDPNYAQMKNTAEHQIKKSLDDVIKKIDIVVKNIIQEDEILHKEVQGAEQELQNSQAELNRINLELQKIHNSLTQSYDLSIQQVDTLTTQTENQLQQIEKMPQKASEISQQNQTLDILKSLKKAIINEREAHKLVAISKLHQQNEQLRIEALRQREKNPKNQNALLQAEQQLDKFTKDLSENQSTFNQVTEQRKLITKQLAKHINQNISSFVDDTPLLNTLKELQKQQEYQFQNMLADYEALTAAIAVYHPPLLTTLEQRSDEAEKELKEAKDELEAAKRREEQVSQEREATLIKINDQKDSTKPIIEGLQKELQQQNIILTEAEQKAKDAQKFLDNKQKEHDKNQALYEIMSSIREVFNNTPTDPLPNIEKLLNPQQIPLSPSDDLLEEEINNKIENRRQVEGSLEAILKQAKELLDSHKKTPDLSQKEDARDLYSSIETILGSGIVEEKKLTDQAENISSLLNSTFDLQTDLSFNEEEQRIMLEFLNNELQRIGVVQ
jgi:hypothetical protein